MKIKELINYGIEKLNKENIEDSTFIAKLLGEKLLNLDKVQMLFIKGEEQIDKELETEYKNNIDKIIQGVPLQYITNEQYFYKSKFYVNEYVLIPQPDTEILVEEAIKLFKDKGNINILDMCTGSGCIGIALAKNLNNAKVTLADISKEALKVATKNAEENCVKVEIIESNMFENIKEKYDIIVSNPPYIETNVIKTLSKDVQNEPKLALDGGEDGLMFYRILANEAYKYLKKEGYLLMEIGYSQKQTVTKVLEETYMYENIYSKQDLSGNDRIIVSKKI